MNTIKTYTFPATNDVIYKGIDSMPYSVGNLKKNPNLNKITAYFGKLKKGQTVIAEFEQPTNGGEINITWKNHEYKYEVKDFMNQITVKSVNLDGKTFSDNNLSLDTFIEDLINDVLTLRYLRSQHNNSRLIFSTPKDYKPLLEETEYLAIPVNIKLQRGKQTQEIIKKLKESPESKENITEAGKYVFDGNEWLELATI